MTTATGTHRTKSVAYVIFCKSVLMMEDTIKQGTSPRARVSSNHTGGYRVPVVINVLTSVAQNFSHKALHQKQGHWQRHPVMANIAWRVHFNVGSSPSAEEKASESLANASFKLLR